MYSCSENAADCSDSVLNQGQTQAQCGQKGAISPVDIIERLFTHQPPTPFTGPKFETVREAAKYFAKVLIANVPYGTDRDAAIRKLREAVMTANAGISLNGHNL